MLCLEPTCRKLIKTHLSRIASLSTALATLNADGSKSTLWPTSTISSDTCQDPSSAKPSRIFEFVVGLNLHQDPWLLGGVCKSDSQTNASSRHRLQSLSSAALSILEAMVFDIDQNQQETFMQSCRNSVQHQRPKTHLLQILFTIITLAVDR